MIIRYLVFLCYIFFFTLISTQTCDFEQHMPVPSIAYIQHPKNWRDPIISDLLLQLPIIKIEHMRDYLRRKGRVACFTSDVYKVTFPHKIKAVFKKASNTSSLHDAYAEVIAYHISLHLGFPYTPPTVLRTINGHLGSLQLFVNTEIDLLQDEEYKVYKSYINDEDVAQLKLFSFVFGQWDYGPANQLICKRSSRFYLVAIDNANIHYKQYVRYGEPPFVKLYHSEKLNTHDFHQPFPFDQAQTIVSMTYDEMQKIEDPCEIIVSLNRKKLYQLFGDSLSQEFYDNTSLFNRRKLRYVVYQNGFYRQFHAFDDTFEKSYVEHCSHNTLATLNALSKETLCSIFSCVPDATFVTEEYIAHILERRDQVIHFFETKGIIT